MTTKTTRITVESQTLLVARRAKAVLAWCRGCDAEVEVIALDGDSLAAVTAAQIHEWHGIGKLHFWQTANGLTRICLTSLFRCFELEQVQELFRSNEIPLN